MPHVSKDKINEQLYQKLFKQLIELPVGLSKQQTSNLFSSLLTKTEQVMLTKRCAAAIMFAEGYSDYRVWTVLKLSPSTAARLRLQYQCGEFDGVVNIIRSQKIKAIEREEFIETMNKILRLGMPSRGKDRWKGIL